MAEKTRRPEVGGDARTPRDPMQHPMIAEVADRVDYIAELMLADRWRSSRTKLELAERWGVTGSTVQNYSGEAGRLISTAIKDRRAAIAHGSIEELERIARMPIVMPGDAAAKVQALRALLKASGYEQPEEDKTRASTVQVVQVGPGEALTSPAMRSLVAGIGAAKKDDSED